MTKQAHDLSRRGLIAAAGIGAMALPAIARAQAPAAPAPVAPPTTITNPPRDFSPRGAPTTYFSDPDVLAVDPSFDALTQANASIKRLWTGALWVEGPAWSAEGRYLVWSDIPNNRQMRWLEDDGHVSVFRMPSNNSNGNSFDFQGRQLSCEHLTRRVVRYELDGSISVLADSYQGKHLNSPNDVAAHPDGSYWFTDPPYGSQFYEGAPDAPGGPVNPQGKLKSTLGQAYGMGTLKRELPTQCYRVAPDGKIDMVLSEEQVPDPNGICFSPDYKKVYIADTGGPRQIWIYDLDGKTMKNGKRFIQLDVPGTGAPSAADGIRCDIEGNIWAGAAPGVQIVTPNAERIGMIRLPETCANVCFGGRARNRLFMAASQSLYSVYVNTQGAHIA
jgi:gluconolactonase